MSNTKEDGSSSKSVIAALCGNILVLIAKIIAFILTGGFGAGSSAIFAEIIHSIGDIKNQGFLLIGIKRDGKKADATFPFGYGKERYFWSTIAATIVCILGIVTIGKGVYELTQGNLPHLTPEALGTFGFAAVMEGIIFLIALHGIRKDKKKLSLRQYIKETTDLSGIAVLFEDFIAVISVGIALGGLTLTKFTENPVYDATASIIIGFLILIVGMLLVDMNRRFLVGRTHEDTKHDIEEIFQRHPKIEYTHDIRAVVQGFNQVIVEADVELREEEILKDINGGAKRKFEQIPRSDEDLVNEVMMRVSALIDELEQQIRLRCPEVIKITIEVEQFKSAFDQMADTLEGSSPQ